MYKTSKESVTDIVHFKGKRVSFYKRAQILVADLWGIMEARGEGNISIDWLTMFADYRVPQALVYLGALRYSDALMQALKNGEKAGTWMSLRSGKNIFWEELMFHIFMSGVVQASCSLLETGERSRSEVVRFGLWS